MANIPRVTGVQVEAAQPEPADLRTLKQLQDSRNQTLEPVTWVVRVALDQIPTPTGQGLELLVGDEIVRKYTQVSDGVAFALNDPEDLQRMLGKELSWRVPGDTTLHSTGVRLTAAMPGVADSSVLPTKREVFARR